MTALLGLICILNLAPVFSYPDGAPAQACVNIYPAGHTNVTRDLNHTGEAWLNLDSFKGGSYIPGNKYTFTLQCTEQFDGMLVQGRLTADGKTPVGTFSSTDILRLSNCDPPNSAVTHTNEDDKNNVTLIWTAPAENTGSVTFFFAVVVDYDVPRKPTDDATNVFFATLKSSPIQELKGLATAINVPAVFSLMMISICLRAVMLH